MSAGEAFSSLAQGWVARAKRPRPSGASSSVPGVLTCNADSMDRRTPSATSRSSDHGSWPITSPGTAGCGDAPERAEEELSLLRVLRDEFHVRPHLRRHHCEVLDELAALDDGERSSVLRARRQFARVVDGLLPFPVAVRAPQLGAGFPQPLGD